jgi:hypothetical protein
MARTMNLSQRVCTTLLVSLALFLCPAHVLAQAEIADDKVLDWTIVGSDLNVLSGQPYTLVNKTLKQSIKYGKRGRWGGINLVWDSSTDLGNFAITIKPTGSPIKYGDRVAISIQGISKPYLRYEKRDIGINLNWSDRPIYEWIVAGGPEGKVVKTKTQVALFNTVEKDFLIYAERGGKAINLRWYIDRNQGGYLDAAKRAAWKKSYGYLEEFFRE